LSRDPELTGSPASLQAQRILSSFNRSARLDRALIRDAPNVPGPLCPTALCVLRTRTRTGFPSWDLLQAGGRPKFSLVSLPPIPPPPLLAAKTRGGELLFHNNRPVPLLQSVLARMFSFRCEGARRAISQSRSCTLTPHLYLLRTDRLLPSMFPTPRGFLIRHTFA